MKEFLRQRVDENVRIRNFTDFFDLNGEINANVATVKLL